MIQIPFNFEPYMNRPYNHLYAISVFLFLLPSIVMVLTHASWFLGIEIGAWIFIISLILSAGIIFLLEKQPIRANITGLFVGLILTWGSIYVSGQFFDCSFDGQWYHQDAIILISEGWNPIWDNPIADVDASGLNANYVNHYPKASWAIQAVLFRLTGNIESGKSIQFLYWLSLMFLLTHFLRARLSFSWMKTTLLVLFVSLSTVSLGQVHSFYVDGLLYSLFGIFLVFLIDFVYFKKPTGWLLIFAFLVLVNIKFTGLVYGGVLMLGATIWVIAQQKSLLKRSIARFALAVVIGVGIIGYPTYVRNTLSKGHPLFPIMGKKNEGKMIAEVQYPLDFFKKNRVQKFVAAHGSIPIYTDHDHASVRKPLFNTRLIQDSIPYFKNHQPVTMSPFGPFEGELWVLFIPILLLFFIRKQPVELYVLLVVLIGSLWIQPEFWNLRYAPQLLLLLAIFVATSMNHNSVWVGRYALFFSFLFIINSVLAVSQNWRWVFENNRELRKQLEPMRNSYVKVQAGWMKSFELKLKTNHITPIYTLDTNAVYEPFLGDAFSGWKYMKEKK
jgi:hypothetical protein